MAQNRVIGRVLSVDNFRVFIKIEDELKYKEMRKQKRLELTRKIFPFLKK